MALGSELAPFFGAAGAAGGAAGPVIERSLRINSPDSAYLNRSTSAGNQKTWTWSGWVKRSVVSGSDLALFTGRGASVTLVRFKNNNLDFVVNGLTHRRTSAKFRDHSAWYHFIWAVDTTQTAPADRSRFYVNGVEITTEWDIDNALTLDSLTDMNAVGTQLIGASDTIPNDKLDAYIAEFYLIDGQQLAATDFGEFDATTGAWNPIEYTGSYGTNGFKLDFSDSSSASALGTDSSGNGNDWTVTGISVNNSQFNYTSGLSYVGYSGGTTITNPSNGFNGNIADRFDGETATGAAQTAIYTWVPPGGVISATSLKIRLQYFGVQSFATISVAVNNGSYYNTGGGTTVTTYDFSSLITGNQVTEVKLKWEANGSGIGSPGWYAVYINDEILIDASGGTDSLFDSPSNGTQTISGLGGELSGNYATLNPLAAGFGSNNQPATISNGNLDWTTASSFYYASVVSTIAPRTGKYYIEAVCQNAGNGGLGFVSAASINSITGSYGLGAPSDGWHREGTLVVNNGSSVVTGMSSLSVGDIIGLALDLDNGKAWWSVNGTYHNSGNPANGTNPTVTFTPGNKDWLIGCSMISPSAAASINFGQRAYNSTAPSGFKPVCTASFDTPVIQNPSTVMGALLWTGDNAPTRDITGLSFQPELVWLKSRSVNNDHNLFDSVRGAENTLSSNQTAVEVNQPIHGWVSNFISGGFSVTGGSLGDVNYLSRTYVAWNWDAGTGSPVSNTDGTITSSVRANASAGFSIVTYTGVGYATVNDNFTVGHGLGVKPAMVIIKKRSSTTGFWPVWHTAYGDPAASGTNTQYILLNSNAAQGSLGGGYLFKDASTSDVFGIGVGSEVNGSGSTFVAYCFAPVAQYSAFGSYIGNGSTDGTFIYTGFRPRWIMLKRSSAGGNGSNWIIYDTVRSPYNLNDTQLIADSSVLENQDNTGSSTAGLGIDVLSNGFKQKSNSGGRNTLGDTYIYAAFAESPFSYSRAR